MAPGMPAHAGSRCAFSLLPFRTFSLLLFGIRLLLLTAAATPNHRNLESVLRHRPAANAHFLVGGRGIYRKHLGTYDCRSLGRFLAALFNDHLFRNFRRLNRPLFPRCGFAGRRGSRLLGRWSTGRFPANTCRWLFHNIAWGFLAHGTFRRLRTVSRFYFEGAALR